MVGVGNSALTNSLANWTYIYNADWRQTQQTFSGTAASTNATGLDTQTPWWKQ